MISETIARVPEGAVPPGFTLPSRSYKLRVWLALGGLALFLLFYLGLSWTLGQLAYRHLEGVVTTNSKEFNVFSGIIAALLTVFMVKALFFIRRGTLENAVEIKREDEPRLFEFIDGIADSVKAPRAHRVFLTPEVNAAVFYDLTLLNLLIPTKKNLNIGLGLVNTPSAAEFKAGLAHEFGHFSQRTMAVNRWVYVGHQIAGNIISKRDAVDDLVSAVSRIDFRIAWIGWVISVVMWAIRAVTECLFRLVILAQRALSREMEFHADLVAVSVTGSDHLINGLHRASAANEAWERALLFVNEQFRKKRRIADIYSVQSQIIARMRDVLADENWGRTPLRADAEPAVHRVFEEDTDHPQGMWMTHPPHRDREENAKRIYIPATIEGPDAWALFTRADRWRQELTKRMYDKNRQPGHSDSTEEDSLREVDAAFARESLASRHRGIYHDRLLFLSVPSAAGVFNPEAFTYNTVDAFPPEEIVEPLRKWNAAQEELARLKAFKPGVASVVAGGVRYRGRTVPTKDIAGLVEKLTAEAGELRGKIDAHDRNRRSVRLGAAAQIGRGWDDHLKYLIGVLHYAGHTISDLEDAHRAFLQTFATLISRGRVSEDGVNQIIHAGSELFEVMQRIHNQSPELELDDSLRSRLGKSSWAELLEPFKLGRISRENIDSWLRNVEGWVGSLSGSLRKLYDAALDQLLTSEESVARLYKSDVATETAPPPGRIPSKYVVMIPGKERPSRAAPSEWDDFLGSDSAAWTGARVAAALALLGVLFGIAGMPILGAPSTDPKVHVYNGLGREVRVEVNGEKLSLPPRGHTVITTGEVPLHLRASTEKGDPIEEFDTTPCEKKGVYVYNVGNAALLVQKYAVYGAGLAKDPNVLGAPRWFKSVDDYVFTLPPTRIETSNSWTGETRSMLDADGEAPPAAFATYANSKDRAAAGYSHARFDPTSAPEFDQWLSSAMTNPRIGEILTGRLRDNPRELLSLRLEQETASPETWPGVAARHRALSAANPDDADLLYLAIRSDDADEDAQDAKFIAAHEAKPANPWLANAAGYAQARRGRFPEARACFEQAMGASPGLTQNAAFEAARVSRLEAYPGKPDLTSIIARAPMLEYVVGLENAAGNSYDTGETLVMKSLMKGDVGKALALGAGPPPMPDRILMLAAASDGAPADAVTRARSLSPEKMSSVETLTLSIALAHRTGGDPAPWIEKLEKLANRRRTSLLTFVREWKPAADPGDTDLKISRMGLRDRGLAYAFCAVALGDKTPASWKQRAKTLLFASERPYFR